MKYVTVTFSVLEGGVFTPMEVAQQMEAHARALHCEGVISDVWDARDPGRSKQAREFDARVQGVRP